MPAGGSTTHLPLDDTSPHYCGARPPDFFHDSRAAGFRLWQHMVPRAVAAGSLACTPAGAWRARPPSPRDSRHVASMLPRRRNVRAHSVRAANRASPVGSWLTVTQTYSVVGKYDLSSDRRSSAYEHATSKPTYETRLRGTATPLCGPELKQRDARHQHDVHDGCGCNEWRVHPPSNSRSRSASQSGRFQISRWSRTPTNVTSLSSAVRRRTASGISTRPCLSGSR